MEFNTDRNTEEVENIAAADNDVGKRLDLRLFPWMLFLKMKM